MTDLMTQRIVSLTSRKAWIARRMHELQSAADRNDACLRLLRLKALQLAIERQLRSILSGSKFVGVGL